MHAPHQRFQQTPPTTPARRPQRTTVRRLACTALFAAVRGLDYAAGTTTGGVVLWWLTHH